MPHELTEIQRNQIEQVHYPSLETKGVDLYRRRLDRTVNPDSPVVIFGAGDAGGFNYIRPALESWAQVSSVNYLIAATNVAKRELSEKHHALNLEPAEDLAIPTFVQRIHPKPSVLIAGHSAFSPDLEQIFASLGRTTDIPSVWLEDMPPFLGFYKRNLATEGKLVIPDHVFVTSPSAAEQETDLIPEFLGRTEVVGNPDWDKIAHEDRSGTRGRVKENLQIGDRLLISYMATKTDSAVELARLVALAIKQIDLQNYAIAFRIHPQEAQDPEMNAKYSAIKGLLGNSVVETSSFSTNEIGLASDLVITDTSTEGQIAVFRGIPAITGLIEPFMRFRPDWKDELPPTPAIALDGSSTVVRRPEEMAEAISKTLFNQDYREVLFRKMATWNVDGRATERFVNRVLQIAYS